MSIMKADDGFAEWVEQQMAMRGLDQAALAERMGLTPAAVSRVLSGGRQPGVDFLHGVARAFNIKPVEVFIKAGWLPDIRAEGVSESDMDMLDLFKTLPPDERKTILDMMRGLVTVRNTRQVRRSG